MIATRVETQAELAREMGVSRRTVIEWTQRKGFPKSPDGGYDVDAVRAWHMDNVAKAVAGDSEDSEDLKTRRLLAECEKLEQEARFKKLKNDITEGELVRMSAIESQLAELLSFARATVEACPDDVTKEMPEEYRTTAHKIVKNGVERFLKTIASWRPSVVEEDDE